MKYTFIGGVCIASVFLSWCFHRNEEPSIQPVPNVQPTPDAQTPTWAQADTGVVVPTESWGVVDTWSADTGFKTKDFSDPEVEEVIDLLQDMIKK